jgi:sporulation protein YlmC with PRC-barrel domain
MVLFVISEERQKMKVHKPHELVGKEVIDQNGNSVGWVDKTWNSWNQDYPGWFFGIKPNENTRNTWFRGTYKLFPIYGNYIREAKEYVTLNKTLDELSRFWNKTIQCGQSTCPADQLVDMSVYDKNYSKVGTFYTFIEGEGPSHQYGCLLDPYLYETWKIPNNMLMPVPANYITFVKDTITLDKTLNELKEYWKQYY